jgi:hydroxypyruvate isomerase
VKTAPDLTLLLEPINQRDKPGYFYSTIGEAADIIGNVGAPDIKIMFDVYHVGVSEGDVLTRLQRHLADIGHVQIAAVPSRAEPDEGEIAYGSVFAALDRLGYAGWTGCEYRPRAGTDEGLTWTKTFGVSL